MSEIQTLVDMGFPKERAEYAIKATNFKGVEPAMEWLLAHADEEIPAQSGTTESSAGQALQATTSAAGSPTAANPDAEASSSTPAGVAAGTAAPETAKSLKCDDCGKLFKDQSEVEFHAAKTGHSNFSESTEEKKPLTEEEKKAQLALIEEKLKQKRIEREERERVEALEREKNRIKSGKDMTEARQRMEEMEMKKIVEQRKREKEEEKAARERVRAQIEADKAARRARDQGPTSPQSAVSSTTPTPAPAAVVTSPKQPPKDYTNTRIQIRLQDGSTLTETFGVKEQLSAVRVFIQMNQGTDLPFGLMTSFPRKVFSDDDFEKPLEVLGLVPSAVLIVTKALV
ncbi:UBX domain-containing protein 1 [Eupeodes corollae]|uniref:UBX domain-containing protein 1 n=1 Tax=Eupeodes corollae TaxID=290404 RepID=UPI00249317C1|nr:UBX domain-containing protein 1 [Eupeodes corollae]